MSRLLRTTAAWRISIWTTLAFAIGTALAFSLVYHLVAEGIRNRSDAWLSGEVEVLAQVSADTPRDHLYSRIVGEVAELATREIPDERNAQGQSLNSVIFLEQDSLHEEAPIWVGPNSKDAFLKSIGETNLVPGVPQSLVVDGWLTPFRLVVTNQGSRTIYLGLSDLGANHVLRLLTHRFLLLWAGTVLMGFMISFASAHRTLSRVERISEAVSRISSKDLSKRLPEPGSSDEISRLAKTFNGMLNRLESSVRELRLVTDSVAHDLKSPVTSIRGTLESLLSDEPNAQWRESICEAIEGLDRLLGLVNTSLDVAEAQAGALSLELRVVNLSETINQLVDLYQPAMTERHHELTVSIEGEVVVDADIHLLHRVISNLLENELAHLPPGGHIAVQLLSQQGFAQLTVEDDGPGFPPDVMERAFERFVKDKHSHGYGLGLALVNAIVHAHGGIVKIRNRATGGASICVRLPMKPVPITQA